MVYAVWARSSSQLGEKSGTSVPASGVARQKAVWLADGANKRGSVVAADQRRSHGSEEAAAAQAGPLYPARGDAPRMSVLCSETRRPIVSDHKVKETHAA